MTPDVPPAISPRMGRGSIGRPLNQQHCRPGALLVVMRPLCYLGLYNDDSLIFILALEFRAKWECFPWWGHKKELSADSAPWA